MLSNIQILIPNRLIEPKLKEIVEKIALAKPNLTFIHDKQVEVFNSRRSFSQNSIAAPDGQQWLAKFRVLDNGSPAGEIQIEHNYSRAVSDTWRIGVRSHLVTTTRGSRGMTYSSNEARIVANAKKYLVGQSHGYILYRKLQGAKRVADRSIHSLTSDLRHGQFLTNTFDAQVLLHSFLTNTAVNPSIESAMRAKLVTPKFEHAMSEHKLGEWFSDKYCKNQLRFIHRQENEYMFYVGTAPDDEDRSHKAQVIATQFDDLPRPTQEKLAVLQLMSDSEIVMNVGQRVDEDTFWVVND